MLNADLGLKERLILGALLPAIFCASKIEGELIVKTPHKFLQMTIGAHSVVVSTFLFLSAGEVSLSIKKVCHSLKHNWVHLVAIGFLFTGALIHILSLTYLQMVGPLDRQDRALNNYLNFCRVFMFSTYVIEYLIHRLDHSRPYSRLNNTPLKLVA